MIEIRVNLVDLISKWENYKKLYIRYENLSMELINSLEWDSYNKWQIALCILKAYINLDSWRIDYYWEDIKDAIDYASWMWYNEVVNLIKNL